MHIVKEIEMLKMTNPVAKKCLMCETPVEIEGRQHVCGTTFCVKCSEKTPKHCPRCNQLIKSLRRL